MLLNELGVAYLKLDREEDALENLSLSVNCLHHKNLNIALMSAASHNNKDKDKSKYNTERRTAGAEVCIL